MTGITKQTDWHSLDTLVKEILLWLIQSCQKRPDHSVRCTCISVFLQGAWRVFLDPCCEQAVKYVQVSATSFSPLTSSPIGRTELLPHPQNTRTGCEQHTLNHLWMKNKVPVRLGEGRESWQPYLSQKRAEYEIEHPPEPTHSCVMMQLWLNFTACNPHLYPQPRKWMDLRKILESGKLTSLAKVWARWRWIRYEGKNYGILLE